MIPTFTHSSFTRQRKGMTTCVSAFDRYRECCINNNRTERVCRCFDDLQGMAREAVLYTNELLSTALPMLLTAKPRP